MEHPFWPGSLHVQTIHARRQDDTDGETGPEHDLAVYLSQDTDVFVLTNGANLRFREIFGGGMSPRTRNAPLVLAEVIRRNNEAQPQKRGDGNDQQ